MNVDQFLEKLRGSRGFGDGEPMVRHEVIPARPARFAEEGDLEIPPALAGLLAGVGIRRLYIHQAEALRAARSGRSAVVVTGTASGKSLAYQLPVLEALLEDPAACALFVYPTKALAQDQKRALMQLAPEGGPVPLRCGVYDGDTPRDERERLRDEANVILTNPDMLHSAILPHHTGWARLLSRLRYVVLDEVHTYRGVFGSHVANVLRRLRRLCDHYGSRPTYLCASATVANPGELAEHLVGEAVQVIDQDGSPRGRRHVMLWNPPRLGPAGERRSANSEARELMVELIGRGVQTIAFARARVVAEVLYRYVREGLARRYPSAAGKVRAYRGGYLPQQRREIERQLFSGELLGVCSTNALELGIDVGGLDAAILVGFPGSVASFWQQAGRAGRGREDSLAVLVAHDAPIDQYLMRHPDWLLGRSPEHATIDPDNPYVLAAQLRAAIYELPLPVSEEKSRFGEPAPAVLDLLAESGEIRLVGGRWIWVGRGYPARDVSLRTTWESTYTIVDRTDGEPTTIGTIDEPGAFMQLHPEAVYLQDGETYVSEALDTQQKLALVRRAPVDYYTQSVTERRVHRDPEDGQAQVRRWRSAQAGFGDVTVTFLTYMYRKIRFDTRESLGFGAVHLPPIELPTTALWVVPPAESLQRLAAYGRNPIEALLGLANALTAVLPLFTGCDPMDVGSAVEASEGGLPALYAFDRYPGGIGVTQKAFQLLDPVFTACRELIASCGCEDGCPSCVGAPLPPIAQLDPESSGRGRVPDKEAALTLVHDLLGLEPYVPKPRPAVGLQAHPSALWVGAAAAEAAAGQEGASEGAGGHRGRRDQMGAFEPFGSVGPLEARSARGRRQEPPVNRPPGTPLPEGVEVRLRRHLQELRGQQLRGQQSGGRRPPAGTGGQRTSAR